MTVEEEERGDGLVLRRGADLLLGGKVRQERVDLGLGHLRRVLDLAKEDEAL